jgi:fermentation-respiration switch protein FrsA (DUF1100 family)
MTVISKIFTWFIFLVLVWSLILIYLRYIERRTLFYPSKKIEFLPAEVGLDFKDVFFQTQDHFKLNGWLIPCHGAKYTVLFCHGNAGNISHRLDKLKFFNQLGCNVFIFDYRGYGLSKGWPSEKGFYLDVKAAYDYLLSRNIACQQLIGYGESLGSAVIMDLASNNKMHALIVDSAFSSGRDMAKFVYPFIPFWVFSSRWDSASKIKSINIPKLMIHSLNDEIVPYELAQKLYREALEPKEFLQIRGGHNSCFFESEEILKEKISDFLNRI